MLLVTVLDNKIIIPILHYDTLIYDNKNTNKVV